MAKSHNFTKNHRKTYETYEIHNLKYKVKLAYSSITLHSETVKQRGAFLTFHNPEVGPCSTYRTRTAEPD